MRRVSLPPSPAPTPPPGVATPTTSRPARWRGRAQAGLTALLGAAVVGGSLAGPAAAGPLTFADDGFPGYFSSIEVVEDQISAPQAYFTVRADFCVHPQAGPEDRVGFDILWDVPITDWVEPGSGEAQLSSTVPVTDARGQVIMNAQLEMTQTGLDTWEPVQKTSVDLTPVGGLAATGGCGTLELPVPAPLMTAQVAEAQAQAQPRSESTSPTAEGEHEEHDPYLYDLVIVDADGRHSTDSVRIMPTDLEPGQPWSAGTLFVDGSTGWYFLTPKGPGTATTVTLQDATLCTEPYEAQIVDAQSLVPTNTEPDLTVSCEGGVKTFTLDHQLRADRQLLIHQYDPRPGPRAATQSITADLVVGQQRVTRTSSVASATTNGKVTGVWVAPQTCQHAPFTDNPAGSAYAAEVRWMQCWGITTGYADGTYRKTQRISRAESVAFLYRYAQEMKFEPIIDDELAAEIGSQFWDVEEDHPHFTPITWAAVTGLSMGYADQTFGPTRQVTRGELAAFVYRLASGGEQDPEPPVTAPFQDVPADHTFAPQIAWMAENDIITGYRDGTYQPSRPISRGEVAAVMHRLHAEVYRTR